MYVVCDYSTLKRKRKAGLVPFVDMGAGSIGYMGYHIADIIAFGVKAMDAERDDQLVGNEAGAWLDTPGESTGSATGGSASARAQPLITPSATMPPSEARLAWHGRA